MQTDPRS